MIDPTLPWGHPEKYKGAFNPGNTRAAIGYSSDGIHWTGYNDGCSVTGRAADAQNQILWDPIKDRYLLVTRTDLGAKGGLLENRGTRVMAHVKDNDLMGYPMMWETLVTMGVDDPKDEKTPAGVPVLQMENMNVWVYENVYFALMHVVKLGEYTGARSRKKVADPDARHESDVIDFYIGTSRDGVNYDKSWIYFEKPLIERGGRGEFDKDMVHPASEIVNHGDEHWIYYGGVYNQYHAPKEASTQGGKVGLATLAMDRFISQTAEGKGTVTTKPFKVEGDMLQVNVDAKGGRFFTEVLDGDGNPIPGFTIKDAQIHNNADELRLSQQWKDHKDISALKGKVVKLRFHLRNAKLYAFQIK